MKCVISALWLIGIVLLSGCASTSPPQYTSDIQTPNIYAEDSGQSKPNYDELVAKVGQLRTTITNMVRYIQINDYLVDNKATLIPTIQEALSTNKEDIFKATGVIGNILDFKVEDVFAYHGYEVVTMLFLWSNPDNSGGLGRVALALDPRNDFNPTSCTMVGQEMISQQELANLTTPPSSDRSAPTTTQETEETKAAEIPATKPWISNDTKNALLLTGAGVLGHWLIDAMQNNGN